MAKVKKLQAKRKGELASGKNLYSVAESATIARSNRQEQEQIRIIETLKQSVEKSYKQMMGLKKEVEGSRRLEDTNLNVDDLQNEHRSVNLKLMQTLSRLEDIKASLKVKSDIFNSGKSYEDSVLQQLRMLQSEQNQLQT